MCKSKVFLQFFMIFLVCFSTNICQSHNLGFARRKCAPYKSAKVIHNLLAYNGKECRKQVLKHQQTFSVPILPKVASKKVSTVAEIEERGYNASTHNILSIDGYYSSIYRISGGKISPPKRGKRAVLLFHGIAGNGASWIIQPRNRNLAFLLVDAGFEVWLANGRGSSPSMKHTYLNANRDISYWSFSFEEMGTWDLPLIVDLMLRETGTKQIYYVCNSIGCAVYLAGLSELPELNEKFKAAFLLAPAAYLGSGYGAIVNLAPFLVGTPLGQIIFNLHMGTWSSEPPKNTLKALGLDIQIQSPGTFCTWSAVQCGLCDKAIFALFGADAAQLNFTDIPNIIMKYWDVTVLRVLMHAGQNVLSCGFHKFDYGRKGNLQKYGSPNPPEYKLDRMKVPAYIFYAESDNLVTPLDAKKTRDAIPSKYMRGFYRVEWSLFNHIDFLIAKDADILVYNRIREIMRKLDDSEPDDVIR